MMDDESGESMEELSVRRFAVIQDEI